MFLWVRPCRQTGHSINLMKHLAHQLLAILSGAERVNIVHQPCDGELHVGDRFFGVVLALLLKTSPVLLQLLAIEGSEGRKRRLTRVTGDGSDWGAERIPKGHQPPNDFLV